MLLLGYPFSLFISAWDPLFPYFSVEMECEKSLKRCIRQRPDLFGEVAIALYFL
jgi:hypothetical protein